MFHKVVSRYTLGMVESLHMLYSKFPAESISERTFKIRSDLTKLLPKVGGFVFLEHSVYFPSCGYPAHCVPTATGLLRVTMGKLRENFHAGL